MNLYQLAWKNIEDNSFRSWVVSACAALAAFCIITTTLAARGSSDSLHKVLERLGAEVMVIPAGNQQRLEHALLMGMPVSVWMPRSVMEQVAEIPGVEAVSPQLFLSTMRGASCCSVSDMFMIAYDPATDFTVNPWLVRSLGRELELGEAIGGRYVTVSEGRDDILIYGYEIELAGNLEPTGSGLDQSMFFTFETALEIARLSPMQAERELVIAPDSISSVMVRMEEGAEAVAAARRIEATIPGVTAIVSADLFHEQRERTRGLIQSAAGLALLVWVMCLLLIGLVTSAALSQRRQEIGVLRALGLSRGRVLRLLLLEGGLLSLLGGIEGCTLAAFSIHLFRNLIVNQLQVPFLFPPALQLALLSVGIVVVTLLSVTLATLVPILRICRMEPGTITKDWLG